MAKIKTPVHVSPSENNDRSQSSPEFGKVKAALPEIISKLSLEPRKTEFSSSDTLNLPESLFDKWIIFRLHVLGYVVQRFKFRDPRCVTSETTMDMYGGGVEVDEMREYLLREHKQNLGPTAIALDAVAHGKQPGN